MLCTSQGYGPDTDKLLAAIKKIRNGWLDIEDLHITSLPPLPATIRVLTLKDMPNPLDLTSLPTGLEYLRCEGMTVAALDLPPSINALHLENVVFTASTSPTLSLPLNLRHLHIVGTRLTSLPPLPATLTALIVEGIPITELPPSLERLVFKNTQQHALPHLPTGLNELAVKNVPLLFLPQPLPANLQYITLDTTQITSLEEFHPDVSTLRIRNTPITALPSLAHIHELEIDTVPLTAPLELPADLYELILKNMPDSVLQSLPSQLGRLTLESFPITQLPALPADLDRLVLKNLPISHLPTLPHRLRILHIANIWLKEPIIGQSSLYGLYCDSTHRIENAEDVCDLFIFDLEGELIQMEADESIEEYAERVHEPFYPAVEHCRAIKTELIETSMHCRIACTTH
jgi:hypothetical protein